MTRTPWNSLLAVLILALASELASAKLVAYYPMDDAAGSVVKDASGNGHDAAIVGITPKWVEGKTGTALWFPGETNPTASVETDGWDPAAVTGQLTVASWVKWEGLNALYQGIVCKSTAWNATGTCWSFELNIDTGNIGFGQYGGYMYFGTHVPQVGEWQHLAVTFDGTTALLYMDGQQVGTTPFSFGPARNAPIVIGAGYPGGWNPFNGTIDEIRLYDNVLSQAELQEAMLGSNPGASSGPVPRNGATDVPRDAVLGWTAGKFAARHDVYFGTGFDDVNMATRTDARGVLAGQGQAAVTYDPVGVLSFGQTYYWRVDEVNAAPDSTIYKGPVWSLTVEPYSYPVKPVKATASSSSNALMGPEKTIDGSGLDALDQHGTSGSTMWLSKKGSTPIWIKYDFDRAYKLHEMWVWNSNQMTELDSGFGARDVTLETSLDGVTWTAVGLAVFNQATAEPNYVYNTTVSLGGVLAKYVRLTITSNWADSTKQAGLSEVRFFYVPVKAYGPMPASGSKGIAIDSTLTWRPGREAVQHQVYLGTDPNSLVLVKTAGEHSLKLSSLGLEYGRTYYWKVNEANDAASPAMWEGDIWSFTTPDYGVVDDFESYNDLCNRVFFSWVDGFGYSASPDCGIAASAGNGSGSTVGNTNLPFAEKTIIHGGKQSMPLAYDNTAGKTFSEATRTFDSPKDWTLGGVKTLALYFKGSVDNGPGQLYLKIDGNRVDYPGGPSSVAVGLWKQWNIDLASVGTSVKAVKTLAIGISGSGKGELYIDDILLYRAAPAVVQPSDPGNNGIVANYKMESNVKDSSGKNNNGTANGDPVYAEGAPGNGSSLKLEGLDDYVDLPIGSSVGTATNMTVCTWVNWAATDGAWQRIFDFGTSTTNYMFLTPSAGSGFTSPLRFAIRMTGSSGESMVSSPSALPAGWHHVAVVIDGVGKTLQLYQDGSVVASGPTLVIPKDLGVTNQNWLGRSQFTTDAYYTGMIDEFRIYSRALSEGEVRYLAGDR
jgi:hypothetical protein